MRLVEARRSVGGGGGVWTTVLPGLGAVDFWLSEGQVDSLKLATPPMPYRSFREIAEIVSLLILMTAPKAI